MPNREWLELIGQHLCRNDTKGKHLERAARAEDVGMPNYRRNRVAGGTYFFTLNLRNRRSDLLVVEMAALRDAVRTELARRPFHIDAWVVLPEHTHCQWTLSEQKGDWPCPSGSDSLPY